MLEVPSRSDINFYLAAQLPAVGVELCPTRGKFEGPSRGIYLSQPRPGDQQAVGLREQGLPQLGSAVAYTERVRILDRPFAESGHQRWCLECLREGLDFVRGTSGDRVAADQNRRSSPFSY